MSFTRCLGRSRTTPAAIWSSRRTSLVRLSGLQDQLSNLGVSQSSFAACKSPQGIPSLSWRNFSSDAAKTAANEDTPAGSNIICALAPVDSSSGVKATITISNPRRLNSLNGDSIAQLTSTLHSLAENPLLRCVVIKGASTETKSPSFTSGADIFQMAKLQSYHEAKEFISGLHEACQAMRGIPVVTIAQIDGLCLGGGLELAAACDFRYATHRSTFSMPETKYGIPSVIEARLLANIIGWQRTKEMVYFAKFYGTKEVEKWGLVEQSCETPEQLEKIVSEAVSTITSYGAKTMREQKRLVSIWEESDLITGVRAGIDSYARMFNDGGSEPKHYMKVFTDRKK